MEAFDALIGTWTLEATHPLLPGAVIRGEVTFEWLEGRRFLIQRSSNDHPDAPDAISVIGADEDGALRSHYFDSRGVQRVYDVAFDGTVLTMARDAPGFSQRFRGELSADGRELPGLWTLSRDDVTWDDDLRITFRR